MNPLTAPNAAITLPKGGGAVRSIGETSQAHPFTGAATATIPISLTPGREGATPTLAVEYSSTAGSDLFGQGWAMAIPRVSRRTDRGIPRYDESDVFLLSGAEDLVPFLDASGAPLARIAGQHRVVRYRPRTEGLFARIERWTRRTDPADVHWRVTSDGNVTSLFGRTPAARIVGPAGGHQTFEWLLEEVFDALGNHTLYEYAADAAIDLPEIYEEGREYRQKYPRRVFYGNLPDPLVDAGGRRVTYADGTNVGPARRGADRRQPSRTQLRRYAFEVIFDYGDQSVPAADGDPFSYSPAPDQQERFGTMAPGSASPSSPSGSASPSSPSGSAPAPVRGDPTTTGRPGFEVRTLRLCRRVLLVHHFAELGGPTLVSSTDFTHAPDPTSGLSMLIAVCATGYRRHGTGYVVRSLPTVTYEYATWNVSGHRLVPIETEGHDGPALSLRNHTMALVDVDGNGLPDLVESTTAGFRVWRNRGDATFDRPRMLPLSPAGLSLAHPGIAFGDIAGNGLSDLVVFDGDRAGFFELTPTAGWASESFRPLPGAPTVPLVDPDVRLIDLTGDGRPDVVVGGDAAITWFASRGVEGFAPPQQRARVHDLAEFPDVPFDEPGGRVRFADMNGDGLVDIVLVHDGCVAYWPSLGHGAFGRRVTMTGTPRIGSGFNPARLFLLDLDGSGPCDLVYVAPDAVRVWFNQGGNRWGAEETIRGIPRTTDLSGLTFADLFGDGRLCLVWSDDALTTGRPNYHALDFHGGPKPHVLLRSDNGIGATTEFTYSTSTRHYLADSRDGRRWQTTLPVPVQVVESRTVRDRIAGGAATRRYRYHHGYFDGREREFRGFAVVDEIDAERFDSQATGPSPGVAFEPPPAMTRTWFHTGAFLPDTQAEAAMMAERWTADAGAWDPAPLPPPGSADEARALRGGVRRVEVYGLDGTAHAATPYQVTSHSHAVKTLQPSTGPHPSVCLRVETESATWHYERDAGDPRVTHEIVLGVSPFGRVTDAVSIAYPRRPAPDTLPAQQRARITFTKTDFIDVDVTDGLYLVGAACQSRLFELTAVTATGGRGQYLAADVAPLVSDLAQPFAAGQWLDYADTPSLAAPQKRLVEWSRQYFRRASASQSTAAQARLPLGVVESPPLPDESLKAAFSDPLVARVFGAGAQATVSPADLRDAGYVREAGLWWIPSGRAAFDLARFGLVVAARDAFGGETTTRWDPYALRAVATRDTAGNEMSARFDYRVAQPCLVRDENGNLVEAVHDALGAVAAIAEMGKAGHPAVSLDQVDAAMLQAMRAATEADSLDGINPDPVRADVASLVAAPFGAAAGAPTIVAAIGKASRRFLVDLPASGSAPIAILSIARTVHSRDAAASAASLQVSIERFDGFGRSVQQASLSDAPGTPDGGGTGRWIVSGRAIFNAKGKPVRQFEPAFAGDSGFVPAAAAGVSPIVLYDALARSVVTVRPDATWRKVVLRPWSVETWDEHDTFGIPDPTLDADVGGHLARLGMTVGAPWLARRLGGALGDEARVAATRAMTHAGTPLVVHGDPQGQAARTDVDAGNGVIMRTAIDRDVRGLALVTTDPRGLAAFADTLDMAGRSMAGVSLDAGSRRALLDAGGEPVFAWDAAGSRIVTVHDGLRRPIERHVYRPDGSHALLEELVYGEAAQDPMPLNLRGRVWAVRDQAGVVTFDAYDRDGHVVSSTREPLADPGPVDWSGSPALSGEPLTSTTRYDPLGRVVSTTHPDGSTVSRTFGADGLARAITLQRADASAPPDVIVSSIAYNARGQRTRLVYGNGVTAEYRYDPQTFRLDETTARTSGGSLLQQLGYVYDAVGNVVSVTDGAIGTVFHANAQITGTSRYTHDAAYRLVAASGREHRGLTAGPEPDPAAQQRGFVPLARHALTDPRALRMYTEQYRYDLTGNLEEIRHTADGQSWTRRQTFDPASNRLVRSDAGLAGEARDVAHDANGHILDLPTIASLEWNDVGQLTGAALGAGRRVDYAYDSRGERVIRRRTAGSLMATRLTLSGYERYAEEQGGQLRLERTAISISDGIRTVAFVERRTDTTPATALRLRFQLPNHLGSASLEVDGQGRRIAYEEFYPYGGSAYQAAEAWTEVSAKRYRYCGKERDEDTGLDYFGARYYAPWLGRWVSPDPIGRAGGRNLYRFAAENPVTLVDPNGHQAVVAQVSSVEQGINMLGELAEQTSAKGAATEHALVYRRGSYVVVEGTNGAVNMRALPKGDLVVAHTHPKGILPMPSAEDIGTMVMQQQHRHAVVTGRGRWAVIDLNPTTQAGSISYFENGVKTRVYELFARATGARSTPFGRMDIDQPIVPATAGDPTPHVQARSAGELARALHQDPSLPALPPRAAGGPGTSGSGGGGGGAPPASGARTRFGQVLRSPGLARGLGYGMLVFQATQNTPAYQDEQGRMGVHFGVPVMDPHYFDAMASESNYFGGGPMPAHMQPNQPDDPTLMVGLGAGVGGVVGSVPGAVVGAAVGFGLWYLATSK